MSYLSSTVLMPPLNCVLRASINALVSFIEHCKEDPIRRKSQFFLWKNHTYENLFEKMKVYIYSYVDCMACKFKKSSILSIHTFVRISV